MSTESPPPPSPNNQPWTLRCYFGALFCLEKLQMVQSVVPENNISGPKFGYNTPFWDSDHFIFHFQKHRLGLFPVYHGQELYVNLKLHKQIPRKHIYPVRETNNNNLKRQPFNLKNIRFWILINYLPPDMLFDASIFLNNSTCWVKCSII